MVRDTEPRPWLSFGELAIGHRFVFAHGLLQDKVTTEVCTKIDQYWYRGGSGRRFRTSAYSAVRLVD